MKDIHSFEPIWENWVVDEEIGHGSYGTVWKAHREDQFSHIRQYAAVKHISIPRQDGPGDDDIPFPSEESRIQYYRSMLNRLIVEIDAMVSLRGKAHIVSYEEHKVVPKERNGGYDLFLRMELLKSLPLHIKETGRPLSRNETIRLGIDIASALETLESRNFVHRDIKPDNIFIDDEGNFKLGDFGTARVLEAAGNASTKTGTPNYMAPEVYTKSIQYDQTVDIYSLGIMLYRYMNNGYLPFMSETEIEPETALIRRIRGERLKPPRNADKELSAIILKACAFEPGDRYQNASDLRKDLLKYAESMTVDVDIPVVCRLDDGQEIYRGIKKASPGTVVKVSAGDFPYDKFINDDKELISGREITVTVDEDGKADPPEAVFVWSDIKTLFSVRVEVICRDENQAELSVRKVDCFYRNRNVITAPVIDGYQPVGNAEIEVEVQKNHTTKPPQVIFEYRRIALSPAVTPADSPAECEVSVLCVTENGEEILSSRRTCRENDSNLVTAPDITGYILTGGGSRNVSVGHDGSADPEKVVFTYRRMKGESKETEIAVVCRDDYGKELKRESATGRSGETVALQAPAVSGYRLVDEKKEKIEIKIDGSGRPEQKEIVFVYEKVKGARKKSKTLAAVGAAAAVLLIAVILLSGVFPLSPRSYTIIWKNDDGTVLKTDTGVSPGSVPEYDGETPVKESDGRYAYSFSGWIPRTEPAEADATYVAVYDKTPLTYIITWLYGTESDTSVVSAGEMPVHADPVREPDERYNYVFTGWDPEIKEADGSTTYTAVFREEARLYSVTWLDDAGKEIDTAQIAYGEEPVHAAPVKEPDQRYTYSFSGWEPDVVPVTGDAAYKAVFTKSPRMYTVTWLDDTGKTIDTSQVPFGEKPSHPVPGKEPDQQYTYSFSSWRPILKTVTEDAVYTAVFRKTERTYTVTWLDDTGKTIGTAQVKYGRMPSRTDPVKEPDQQYTYSFSGWEPDVVPVTGDAAYKAAFTKSPRKYTVTWQDDAGKTIGTAQVEYGQKPTHTDPVKDPDRQYTYSFSNWEPDIVPVTGDAVYKAAFTKSPRMYTITWQDDTGKTIDTSQVPFGKKPSHSIPGKEPDQQYTYSFSSWRPVLKAVTEDAVYTAVFRKTGRSYTVTWQDDTGKTIGTAQVKYGQKPTRTDPVKNSDRQYTYSFSGWEPDVVPVTGDAVYKAAFTKSPRKHTITWQDDAGKTIDTTQVEYGQKPLHSDPEKKPDKQYRYIFDGWQPPVTTVRSDKTYKASFRKEPLRSSDWTCSVCNASNSFDDLFCTNCAKTRLCLECGKCILREDKYCTNCAIEAGKWKCSKCGALVGADNMYCVNCGTKRHLPGVQ